MTHKNHNRIEYINEDIFFFKHMILFFELQHNFVSDFLQDFQNFRRQDEE